MPNRIRVGVVDDHPMFREGVVFTLAAHEDIEIVGTGGCSADAIRIAREMNPDVVILDMNMPGGGMSAVEHIGKHFPTVKTMMLTVVADEDQVRSALGFGVRGYLLKGSCGTELSQSVRLVNEGEFYVSHALAAKLLSGSSKQITDLMKRADRFSHLSDREAQILGKIVEGLSNREIGVSLDLSEKTIKHYVTSILNKLHVRNRVEAAILASDRPSLRPEGATQAFV